MAQSGQQRGSPLTIPPMELPTTTCSNSLPQTFNCWGSSQSLRLSFASSESINQVAWFSTKSSKPAKSLAKDTPVNTNLARSFGGFASKYIKGKFFMDVHPPLAKLLLTLAGWLAGFDGDFDFKDIGKDYLEPGVPYVAMRLLPAIMGVMTVPMMFLTLKASGCRTMTAALGAGMIIFGRESRGAVCFKA